MNIRHILCYKENKYVQREGLGSIWWSSRCGLRGRGNWSRDLNYLTKLTEQVFCNRLYRVSHPSSSNYPSAA